MLCIANAPGSSVAYSVGSGVVGLECCCGVCSVRVRAGVCKCARRRSNLLHETKFIHRRELGGSSILCSPRPLHVHACRYVCLLKVSSWCSHFYVECVHPVVPIASIGGRLGFPLVAWLACTGWRSLTTVKAQAAYLLFVRINVECKPPTIIFHISGKLFNHFGLRVPPAAGCSGFGSIECQLLKLRALHLPPDLRVEERKVEQDSFSLRSHDVIVERTSARS